MLEDIAKGDHVGNYLYPKEEIYMSYHPVLEPIDTGKPWKMLHSSTRSHVAERSGKKRAVHEQYISRPTSRRSNVYKPIELENIAVSQSPLVQKIRCNDQEFYLGIVDDDFIVYDSQYKPQIVKQNITRNQQHRGFLIKEGNKIIDAMLDRLYHVDAYYPRLPEFSREYEDAA